MRMISGKQGKRGGNDDVVTDLILLDPDEFTRLYHPLHVKTAVCSDEPLQLNAWSS